MTDVIGFGLAPKLLMNPYPLGGHEGYEFGVSAEFLSLEPIADLGSGSSDQGEFTIYNFSVSKGLYRDIDINFQFAPPFQEENIGSYGVSAKFKVWRAEKLPLFATFVLTGGGSQVQSLITSNLVQADLLVSMSIEEIAMYFGFGQSRLVTRFTGGADSLTDDLKSHTLNRDQFHNLFGLSVQVDRIFFAFQLDRYVESIYSTKIGYRF